jgi:hypothetical protein
VSIRQEASTARNFVSHTKRRTQIQDVREQGAEENFGPKREEMEGDWRRLRNEELLSLYISPNIITEIKSRM